MAGKRRKTKRSSRYTPFFRYAMIVVVTYIVVFMLLAAAISPERYDIRIGQPAPNTIKASKDVEDTIATAYEREQAAAAVLSIYVRDETVLPRVESAVISRLNVLKQVNALIMPSLEGTSLSDDQLDSINAQLAPTQLTQVQALALEKVDHATMTAICDRAIELVRSVQQENILENQLEAKIASIDAALKSDGYDDALVNVLITCLRDCMEPNYSFDQVATEAAKQLAHDSVRAVTRIKGEVIVSDGEIITEAQYQILDSLGMIKESGLDISLYYGVALFLLIVLLATIAYLFLFERELLADSMHMVLLSLVSILVIAASLLTRQVSPYLMPVSLGVMLIAQLLKPRLALFMNIVFVALISLFASASGGLFTMAMFTVVANALVTGPAALLVLRLGQQRMTTLLAGICVGATGTVMTLAVGLINDANLANVLVSLRWSATSGPLAAVLCITLMPVLEWMFNIVTPAKLLEISNPNSPLLRRLLLEAPGTYHHSIIVANLAEAAASEIGANGLLARVGAYYHDVGKLKRPLYFKENQMGDNPHDRTDPRVSTAILTSHTRDGVEMAREERIPEPIIRVIQSHHGDTPVMYFYDKCVKLYGEDMDISMFRYEGPKPKTPEEAIVMLADTVEAAARAMPNPSNEQLAVLIRDLVRGKVNDGQLDECTLTFHDVERICSAFQTVLSGVFHERIEYPTMEIPRKEPSMVSADAPTSSEKNVDGDGSDKDQSAPKKEASHS